MVDLTFLSVYGCRRDTLRAQIIKRLLFHHQDPFHCVGAARISVSFSPAPNPSLDDDRDGCFGGMDSLIAVGKERSLLLSCRQPEDKFVAAGIVKIAFSVDSETHAFMDMLLFLVLLLVKTLPSFDGECM